MHIIIALAEYDSLDSHTGVLLPITRSNAAAQGACGCAEHGRHSLKSVSEHKKGELGAFHRP